MRGARKPRSRQYAKVVELLDIWVISILESPYVALYTISKRNFTLLQSSMRYLLAAVILFSVVKEYGPQKLLKVSSSLSNITGSYLTLKHAMPITI